MAWPYTDLGNNNRDTGKRLSSTLWSSLWATYTLLPTSHPPAWPPASSLCRATVLCGLIEVDCGIISLIKFFRSFRLSCSSSCQTRVVERRPSSIRSSGASHPPITADHCLNYSSLLSLPFLLLSNPKLRCTLFTSLSFSFSLLQILPKWGGKDL